MKNLMVYIGPIKDFTPECKILTKIQIDNCHRLGWKNEDILLVTNWSYEYNGVKSIVVGDEHYCTVRPRSIKTSIIPTLIDMGIIEKGQIYWNHDFDAFQINWITDEDLGLDGFDFGLTDYGWRSTWSMGSYFVKSECRDVFLVAKDFIFRDYEDEQAIVEAMKTVPAKYKRMNITYNLGSKYVKHNFSKATKPLKVAHFHPRKPGLMGVFSPYLPKDFINILNQYGYK